jgi:hypothetical protein
MQSNLEHPLFVQRHLADNRLPLRRFKRLWHVGTLDIAHKGHRGASLEGTGCSVSQYPEAWRQIARLGGFPLFELRRPGNRFLEFHRLTLNQRLALQDWGVAYGYLELRTQFELKYYDSEQDGLCVSFYDSEVEARAEAPDWDDGTETNTTVTPVQKACPTPAMTARLGFETSTCNALDIVATFFVEDETKLDGVWWQDTYAPESLSAPRGVIVLRALPAWQTRAK